MMPKWAIYTNAPYQLTTLYSLVHAPHTPTLTYATTLYTTVRYFGKTR